MKFLMMALKNVLRSKGRAVMTFSVLALGVFIFIFYGNFMEGFVRDAINGMINEDIAHIRIRTMDYDEDLPYNKTNMWYAPSTSLDSIEGVAYTPRLLLSADIDNYVDTLPIVLIGIDPEKDQEIFKVTSTSKEPLNDTAWVGASIAKDMGVDIGDYVNLTFRSPEGAYISGEYEIGGLLNSSNPIFSEQSVIIDLKEFQSLINTNLISYYSIRLDSLDNLDSVAQNIKQLYPNQEVLTWEDLTEDLRVMMKQKDQMFSIFYIIIAIIAFLGLMNSILISVWEKRKNTGTLRALGYFDDEITKIFIYEGLWIGLGGVLIGIILGALLNIPLSTIGINFAAFYQTNDGTSFDMGIYVPATIYSVWNPIYFIGPLIVIPIVSMLISYFPAKKSITMSIVDCIKNKE